MNKFPYYKSPLQKWVKFFEQSRDQWKSKCLDRQVLIRKLQNKIRHLETSRCNWKNKTVQLKERVSTLESQLNAVENQLSVLKQNQIHPSPLVKKTLEKSKELTEAFNIVPAHHTYSVGHIMLFISLVLEASNSLQAAAKSLSIIAQFLPISNTTPSWTGGRLWLLRFGYYKLIRPKTKANDWIWIVDHTVQMGGEKCFVIFGIRLSHLPAAGHGLKHLDVEPITLSPVLKSNGHIVYEQLEQSIEKTGIPREIIGDYGSDLKAGVDLFCQAHQETCYIYDIKHKTAAVLKSELKNNQRWQDFTSQASATKNQLQQTPLAHLAPPNQKTKARYMNLDTLVLGGKNTLAFLDKQEKVPHPNLSQKPLWEKLGWLTTFRQSLQKWEEMLVVIGITETFVRKQGIYANCFLDLSFILPFNNSFES